MGRGLGTRSRSTDAKKLSPRYPFIPAATRGYQTRIDASLNGGTITGKLTVIGGSLLQPVYLKVKSNGQTMYTLTDAYGNFAFNVLSERFKETLERMGFPEPEQLKLLTQLMPATLPLLEELLRFQKVPSEKGRQGEVELIQLLEEYYPEDDCQPLGGSGDTDALAIPRFNGTSLGQKVLIESKKNSSGWKRSFIEQVRNHMKLRGERFAILAVDVMPKNSNGFFFEQCSEGVILVTDRSFFHVSYGAVRSALIALQPFLHRDIDFRRLFAEKKISEAIDEACRYSEWTKRLREKAQRIDTNTKGIIEDVNQLDSHLKGTLEKLQTRINEAVVQIEAAETKPVIATGVVRSGTSS